MIINNLLQYAHKLNSHMNKSICVNRFVELYSPYAMARATMEMNIQFSDLQTNMKFFEKINHPKLSQYQHP